ARLGRGAHRRRGRAVDAAHRGRAGEPGGARRRVRRPRAAESSGVPSDVTGTFWSIARRPKWLGVLALVLIVAGIFAWLGRWQLERAVDDSRAVGPDTEIAIPLSELVAPQQPIEGMMAWRRVEVELSYV